MTGDGAVVAQRLAKIESATWKRDVLDEVPWLISTIRQQAAEIERLTRESIGPQGLSWQECFELSRERYALLEVEKKASEARAADLLKALEGVELWCREALIFVRDKSADTPEEILMAARDKLRTAIAAAKGGTA